MERRRSGRGGWGRDFGISFLGGLRARGGTSRSAKYGMGVNTAGSSERADFPVLGIEPVTNPSLRFPMAHPAPPLQRYGPTNRPRRPQTMQRSQPENPVEGISGWLDRRKAIARVILWERAVGRKIDPSRFWGRPDSADDRPAVGLDDRVVPRDFADDAGWPGAAFGHRPGVDRTRCSNDALGRSGGRSRTAGHR
jgi:hypothetical protein